jgi:hypothetical protein
MKKIIFTFLLAGIAMFASAQYYYLPYINAGTNPGGLNNDNEFPVAGGLPAGWATIQGTSATPVWSPTQTIPFSFSFSGNVVSSYKISTTGVLTFAQNVGVAPAVTPAALPSALLPDSSICIWGLNGLGANDNVVSKTFGTAPNRQHWIFFTSYGYGNVISDASNFTYWGIVLEETTNNIHIVDCRTGGYTTTKLVSAGVQVNSTTAWSVANSPALLSLATTDATAADNTYYTFTYGIQPAFDLSVNAITTPNFLVIGANNITGTIKNLGTTTITSFTLNYKINGGAIVSTNITGLNIASLASYNFTSTTPWTSTTSGVYSVECYATNLNGSNADQNLTNDKKTKSISILAEIVTRLPLFEIFTSSTCPPCTPGNLNFHGIVDTINAAQHVYIKYQQDYPGTGDPYASLESTGRHDFYGITSIPRMEIDGGWNGNANSFTYALYQAERAIPAQYKLTGTSTADTITKTFSAKIHYSPLFMATGTKLYCAIQERKTTKNIKTNGETEFIQVMKKMMPDHNGTSLSNIAIGAWDSVSVTYTFNGNYRLPINGQAANYINLATEYTVEEFGDLRMMAWVQAPTGTKQVYQSINLPYKLLNTGAGVGEMDKAINTINIYPNPADKFASVEINTNSTENVTIKLLDNKGDIIEAVNKTLQTGLFTQTFDLSNLANGVYHIAVIDQKQNAFVKRVIVVHP